MTYGLAIAMARREGLLERIQRWNSQNLLAKWLDKSDKTKISVMIPD